MADLPFANSSLIALLTKQITNPGPCLHHIHEFDDFTYTVTSQEPWTLCIHVCIPAAQAPRLPRSSLELVRNQLAGVASVVEESDQRWCWVITVQM